MFWLLLAGGGSATDEEETARWIVVVVRRNARDEKEATKVSSASIHKMTKRCVFMVAVLDMCEGFRLLSLLLLLQTEICVSLVGEVCVQQKFVLCQMCERFQSFVLCTNKVREESFGRAKVYRLSSRGQQLVTQCTLQFRCILVCPVGPKTYVFGSEQIIFYRKYYSTIFFV